MVSHTLGPWKVIKQNDWRHNCVPIMSDSGANRPDKSGYVEPGAVLIASCSNSHVTNETVYANAHLIAAAPELQASCIAMMKYMESGFLIRNVKDDNKSDWAIKSLAFVKDMQVMHRAITSAEGKQP